MLALYENLSISTGRLPLPVIKGQHLLDWGYEGRLIGSVLTQCYEAQLMGEFDSLADAESWVKKNFKSNH